MRKSATFCLILSFAVSAFAAFQGNKNFRNVAITNAAQCRTDWRSCAVSGKMDWSSAETLGEGVVYLPLKLTTADGWARQMYCHAVRVDTSKSCLRFTGNDRCEGWGEPNTEFHPYNKSILKNTVREKTADFMARFRGSKTLGGRERNMILAVNGQGWGGTFTGETWSGTTETITYTFNSGWARLNYLQYSEGIQISNASYGNAKGYCPGVFVVWKDGTIDIVDTIAQEDIPRVWHAVTPHMCRLMTDGEITVKHYSDGEYVDYSDTTVRPRTAYGISSDKRYFYAVVLDGDSADGWSAGATFMDTAKAMKAAGCHQALNMDGGGSSNIVGWDKALNRPKVLGRPSEGFEVGGQRDGGSQCGIYLASIVATVGDWRYDSADALVQDIADGELPDGAKEADVIGAFVFSSEKPTLAEGADFTFSSTNGSTVGWADGEGKVAAGTRVGFSGVRFAEGSRTVSVAAGGKIVIGDGVDIGTVKTADDEGFVLGGTFRGKLTIDCATAKTAGTAFGTSELPYAETLRLLTNLVCATENVSGSAAGAPPRQLACAERVNGKIVLKWGGITFSSNAVRVCKDDKTAVVNVTVAGVSPTIVGEDVQLAMTVTSDDGTSVSTYSQKFDGVGSYVFKPTGAGFGYSYRITLVDGEGKEVANVGSADGVFTFGTESEWFVSDSGSGTVRGGTWTSGGVFTATEGGKSGKVRIVTEVVVDDDCGATDEVVAKELTRLSDGMSHSALILKEEERLGVWSGLIRDGGNVTWRRLNGGEVNLDDSCAYILMSEIDFSSGKPRVRYFAGPKASGTATLLSDASGQTAFDGVGLSSSVSGVITLERFVEVNYLAGYQRTKGDDGAGTVLYLVKAR